MSGREAFVIAISGPSGAGKSTLVKRVAMLLSAAATLYHDDYARVARWHPDSRRWAEEGCDPNTWVSIPRLTHDLRALRAGLAITLPGTGQVVTPASTIVLEEPWGRDRDELRPLIDFVAHIALPLDIALCRKIIREAADSTIARDPLAFAREYLAHRLGDVYRRQQQAGERADLVLDGTRPPDDLAKTVLEAIRQRC